MTQDPVCGMQVDGQMAIASAVYRGQPPRTI
jgi:YHS domain-containing protein